MACPKIVPSVTLWVIYPILVLQSLPMWLCAAVNTAADDMNVIAILIALQLELQFACRGEFVDSVQEWYLHSVHHCWLREMAVVTNHIIVYTLAV